MLWWKGLEETNGEGEGNGKAEGSCMVEVSLCNASVFKDFFLSICKENPSQTAVSFPSKSWMISFQVMLKPPRISGTLLNCLC